MTTRYKLDWCAGPSAQVEVFFPSSPGDGYQLKYTPAARSTLRPPMQSLTAGPGDIKEFKGRLVDLLARLDPNAGSARGDGGAAVGAQPDLLQELKDFGGLLYDVMLPPRVKDDLAAGGTFLELGIDEDLLQLPWELFYDGSEFLSLKHRLGRFVNARVDVASPIEANSLWDPTRPARALRMLVVAPHRPETREATPASPRVKYPPLPGAEEELKAIINVVSDKVDLDVLSGADAKRDAVLNGLRDRYDVIHYCGHVRLDAEQPRRNALVLHDADLGLSMIEPLIAGRPPVLAFINGCESAGGVADRRSLDVFGIARSFIKAGTYFLGSRAKVEDAAGKEFAAAFYKQLFGEGQSLGAAVMAARLACRRDDFGWASYVLYGDPRLVMSVEKPPP